MRFKLVLLLLAIVLTVQVCFAAPTFTPNAAVLLSADGGSVIFSQNADMRIVGQDYAMLMTALVAVENIGMSRNIVFTEDMRVAYFNSYRNMRLKVGEVVTAEMCLNGMLVGNAVDAAYALAYEISGSLEQFARLMNKKAAELGMSNSNFTNPAGIPASQGYTTLADLNILFNEAMRNPHLQSILSTGRVSYPATNIGPARYIYSNNHFIEVFHDDRLIDERFIGGFCPVNGETMAVFWKKDGAFVTAIIANADIVDGIKQSYAMAQQLYDYVETDYGNVSLMRLDEIVREVPVTHGKNKGHVLLLSTDNVNCLLGSGDKVETEIEVEPLTAPVTKGEIYAEARYYVNGKLIAAVPLAAADNVQLDYISLYQAKLIDMLGEKWVSTGLLLTGGVCVILIALYFIIRAILRSAYKRRKRKK